MRPKDTEKSRQLGEPPTPSQLIDVALKLPQPLGSVLTEESRVKLLEEAFRWWRAADSIIASGGRSEASTKQMVEWMAAFEKGLQKEALEAILPFSGQMIRFDDKRLWDAIGECKRRGETKGVTANRVIKLARDRAGQDGVDFPYTAKTGAPLDLLLKLLSGGTRKRGPKSVRRNPLKT